MNTYKIKITERLEKTISVLEADNVDDALETVKRMYKNSEFILTADDHADTEFTIVGEEPEDDKKTDYEYICECGHAKFAAQQIHYNNVIVGSDRIFDIYPYAAGQPFGPYACIKCGKVYDKPPLRETKKG